MLVLNASLLNFSNRVIGIISLERFFTKFYSPHYKLISKFNVWLKSLLHQGLSEPESYDDLVYKFKKIIGRTEFSDQFRKIIICHTRFVYDLNVM